MSRRTSIEAYRKIEHDGLLSERRFQVYRVLFHHGPLTAGEVWAFHLKDLNVQLNSISPRTAELARQGVIISVGERKCRVTNQTCLVWDVTERLPEKPVKQRRIPCRTCEGRGWMPEPKKHPRPLEAHQMALGLGA